MARQPNPFRPGFNQSPARLVGRDPLLSAAREALDVAALDARTPRPLVLVGPRGVGKTVLLGEIAAVAAVDYSWITVHLEIRPNTAFTGELVRQLNLAAQTLAQTPPTRGSKKRITGGKISANLLGVGAELTIEAEESAPSVDALALALRNVMSVALERQTGLVLTVDELQLAGRAELASLTAVLQQHVPDGWPLVVAFAGLPSLRDPGKTVTYLERGEWHELGLLDHDDTISALLGPAEDAGRPMEPDAADYLATLSGGYPYAVQVMGHHAWRASTGHPRITRRDAVKAGLAADLDLAAGLYAARWYDASAKEQGYLAALATLGAATNADIARHLDQRPGQLSYLRDRLIRKGTLYPEGSKLRFLVPGMAEWIKRQTAE